MSMREGFIWDKFYHKKFEGKTHWAANLEFIRFLTKEEFWSMFVKTQYSFDHNISTKERTAATAKMAGNFNQAIAHNIWQGGGPHLVNGFAQELALKNKSAKKGEHYAALFKVSEQWQVTVPSWESIQEKLDTPKTIAEPVAEKPQMVLPAAETNKKDKVLSKIRELHWEKFEHLVTDKVSTLMNAKLETTRPRGDGGKDSVGHIELALGVQLPIVIQSKQQKANVDGDTVAAFCHRVQHGTIGFFITTSDFTPQARIEAENARISGKNIYLISGTDFASAIEPITEFTKVEQETII